MQVKRNDYVFLSIVLIAALAVFFIYNFALNKEADFCEIYKDGELFGTYSLRDDETITISTKEPNVSENVIVIKDGQVYMIKASCPDKTCMHQGKIKKANSQIICLPNRVLIRVKGKNAETDTTVG